MVFLRIILVDIGTFDGEQNNFWNKLCLKPQISQPKLGQIGHVGDVLKMSGPEDFKSVPGFEN